jgi:hypothetical protein
VCCRLSVSEATFVLESLRTLYSKDLAGDVGEGVDIVENNALYKVSAASGNVGKINGAGQRGGEAEAGGDRPRT